jgi:hypothetical protein
VLARRWACKPGKIAGWLGDLWPYTCVACMRRQISRRRRDLSCGSGNPSRAGDLVLTPTLLSVGITDVPGRIDAHVHFMRYRPDQPHA